MFKKSDKKTEYRPIKAWFSVLVYVVSLLLGFAALRITGRVAYLLMVFFLPSVFFLVYTILTERKREWQIFFGIWEAIGVLVFGSMVRILYFF